MQEENTKFLKIEKIKLDDLSLPNNVVSAFVGEDFEYFFIKADSFLSSALLEDEDADLDEEYKKILPKLEGQALKLQELGFTIISFDEFKDAKQEVKDKKEKSYLSNLTEEEQFVHEKIKKFLEEYDVRTVSQKTFIISLRGDIINGETFTDYFLEDKAERKKINLDELFDVSFQMVIADFANSVSEELKVMKNDVGKRLKI